MINIDLPIQMQQNDLLRLFSWHMLDAAVPQPACELIGAGSYTICNSASGLLTTSPGAGVGLALYDKLAGVGGIGNFLLAEPATAADERKSDYYVSSGLPAFIEALVAAGAHRQRLVAVVAGGSCLVDDLFNAGDFSPATQVIDAALAILERERISIASMEVGGLQQLSLLLDAENWSASIKLIEGVREGSPAVQIKQPSTAAIEEAIDGARPIPQIAMKILRLLGCEESPSFAPLAEEIKRDQVVSSKILSYINSAYFGPSRRVDSIERAMLLLGEKNLLEIAVSAAAGMIYSGQEGGYSLMRGGLYRHALATAHAAKVIATVAGGVEPGIAYTAGLVHDIGKVVLDHFVAEALPFFYRQHGRAADFIMQETDLFGMSHLEVGLKLAQKWRLPDSLSQVISYHHCPEGAPEENSQLVHIVFLADLLASVYLSGVEMEPVAAGDLGGRLTQVGLHANQLSLIVETVPWKSLMYL